MKLLLVQPTITALNNTEPIRCSPPMGLAYIASYLRQQKYDVEILDAKAEGYHQKQQLPNGNVRVGLSTNEISNRISGYDVIGVSCLSSAEYSNAREIIHLAKQQGKTTIMGGAHPTLLTKEVMNDTPELDFVVLSEGELSTLRLINALSRGTNEYGNGVAYRDRGKIKVAARERDDFVKDLDFLPFPARDLFAGSKTHPDIYAEIDMSHRGPTGKRYTNLISSRGCPNSCTNCASSQLWLPHYYRIRSPENVITELEEIANMGYTDVEFDDDSATANKSRFVNILDGIIERELPLTFGFGNGVNLCSVDEYMLERMKKAGVDYISFAMESGSQRVLDEILHKPLRLEKVPSLLKKCAELGIKTDIFTMWGIAGETKDEIDMTQQKLLEWIEIYDAHKTIEWRSIPVFFRFTPLPGTELYSQCAEQGYLPDHLDFLRLRFTKSVITTQEFSPEYIEEKIQQTKDTLGKINGFGRV